MKSAFARGHRPVPFQKFRNLIGMICNVVSRIDRYLDRELCPIITARAVRALYGLGAEMRGKVDSIKDQIYMCELSVGEATVELNKLGVPHNRILPIVASALDRYERAKK